MTKNKDLVAEKKDYSVLRYFIGVILIVIGMGISFHFLNNYEISDNIQYLIIVFLGLFIVLDGMLVAFWDDVFN